MFHSQVYSVGYMYNVLTSNHIARLRPPLRMCSSIKVVQCDYTVVCAAHLPLWSTLLQTNV